MPPTANIISGKTSVCSRPLVDAWRSASVPGSAAAWPANAVTPPSRCRSANSSTLMQRQHQQHAPQEDRGAVDGDRALGHDRAVRGTVAALGRASWRPRRSRRSAATQAGQRRAPTAPGSARARGDERLDQHAEHGDAEDDEQRRERGVLDVRGLRTSFTRRPPRSAAVTAPSGAGSCAPTWLSVARRPGSMTSISGLGKKPSATISSEQRRQRDDLTRAQVVHRRRRPGAAARSSCAGTSAGCRARRCTMPSTAKTAYHQLCTNAPVITRNSETNGDSPGSDSDDRPPTRKTPASTGATFCTPP